MKDRLFLRKIEDNYVLHRIKDNILTIEGDSHYKIGGINPFYKLSKENCDGLFGVVDVVKFAREYVDNQPDDFEYTTDEYWNAQVDFKAGFDKAMELNKDKLFTAQQMYEFADYTWKNSPNTHPIYNERLLQQLTEIDVEIVMDICGDKVYEVPEVMLDENGCVILKKLTKKQ